MTGFAPFVTLLSHWRRHRIELATLLLGLSLATALWSGVQALNSQARQSYAAASSVLGGASIVSIFAPERGPVDREIYIALRRLGWPVSPIIEGWISTETSQIRLIGIDPLTLPRSANMLQVVEGADTLLRFLRPPYQMVIDSQTFSRSDTLPVADIAVSPDLPPATAIVDIALAEELLGHEATVSRLLMARETVPRALPPELADRIEIVETADRADLTRLTDSFHLNLTAFGLLSYVVGMFIVYSAISLSFEKRKPMIRTMRACGVSARSLIVLLCLEMLVFALVAGAIGMCLGYLIAAILLPDVRASLRGLYGAQVAQSLHLTPLWWFAGLTMSATGALLASGMILWRAARLPVLAPTQPEAWNKARQREDRVQGGLAILLCAVAILALSQVSGLLVGFGGLAALVIGAALALPPMLALLLRMGQRFARGPVAQWVWADNIQNLGPMSVAMMALLIALAVNIGVGTMVESFRRTFVVYLDQRFAQEVFVQAPSDDTAIEIADWLAQQPETHAVLRIWKVQSRHDGWPIEIRAYSDHPTFRDTWPLRDALPDLWTRLDAGDGVLLSEQSARRFGKRSGNDLILSTPAGPWPVLVLGTYADYGNPEAQAIGAFGEIIARWPDADATQLGARADPTAVPALLDRLRATFELSTEDAFDQTTLKRVSLAIFEKTFAVTAALNVLTLGVAGIALFTSLLALNTARLTRLAPIWALGLRRRALAGLELVKTLLLATLTTCLAVPLGLAVAWVLTNVINVQAFGWQLPIFLFPAQWAQLGLMAICTAFAAAIWPAYQLLRLEPAQLLQVFRHER